MLPTVTPVDPAWLDISAQRERFKLCFANGYWDCSEDRFYEGSIPEHRFLSGVRAPLQPRDQRYVDLVHHGAGGDVQASLQQHGGARLHAQGTGAALADDQAANCFVLGDSNTGKGVLTRFLELTFPGVVAQFNASRRAATTPPRTTSGSCRSSTAASLSATSSTSGPGRPAGARSARASTARSRGASCPAGRIAWSAACCMLHRNAIKVIPRFTPFILANDAPEIDNPSDSGTHMDRHAVDRDRARAGGPHEFRADKSLKGRIAQREYQNTA
jgi:hypothetical protein